MKLVDLIQRSNFAESRYRKAEEPHVAQEPRAAKPDESRIVWKEHVFQTGCVEKPLVTVWYFYIFICLETFRPTHIQNISVNIQLWMFSSQNLWGKSSGIVSVQLRTVPLQGLCQGQADWLAARMMSYPPPYPDTPTTHRYTQEVPRCDRDYSL